MEDEVTMGENHPFILEQLVPTFLPVLLVSVSYVDPGKWVAAVEGGAHFGTDLVFLVIIFNSATILWQYLSAHISVVTGRNLMQICAEEYDKLTCLFLGVQTELAVIVLDISMVFGVAHGINAIFGFNLAISIILAAPGGFLHLFFSTFLANSRVRCLYMSMAGFILLLYFMEILSSQQEMSFSLNGFPTKLSSESTFAVMCLLGASAMPQNFYAHSFVVQQCKESSKLSKEALFHDHFFAIVTSFSGIALASYFLMNSAANIFYSGELPLHTFNDALSVFDQVFRSPMAHCLLLLVLFVSSQITSALQNAVMCSMWKDHLKIDFPSWLHHALIRGLTIFTVFYCVRNSGAEGMYRLLVFTQVLVSLLLPSSVVPLFRVASSRDVMGVHRISPLVEFFALVLFVGMLGLKLVFVLEMIFGDNDWVGDLMWNLGNIMIAPYFVLLIVACLSFSLTLWLAVTPLRCTLVRMDPQAHTWDVQSIASNSVADEAEELIPQEGFHKRESFPELRLEAHPYTHISSLDFDLPDSIMEEPYLSTIEENPAGAQLADCELNDYRESVHAIESTDLSEVVNTAFTSDFPDPSSSKIGTVIDREKTVEFDKESQLFTEPDMVNTVLISDFSDTVSSKIRTVIDREEKSLGFDKDSEFFTEPDREADAWELQEASGGAPPTSLPSASEGSGSLGSLNGKSDDGGSGPISLSRLSGLGRAARRQLTVILDEFWGQLYDFHGNASKEVKEKRIDVSLGTGARTTARSGMSEASSVFSQAGKESSAHSMRHDPYDSPRQQRFQQGSSPLWSSRMGLLDAYVQNSTHSPTTLYPSERRYSSLRAPLSSSGWDYQPTTVHGYQIASYLSRMAIERAPDYLHSQAESPPAKPAFVNPSGYRDSLSLISGPPGFPRVAAPHIGSQQPYYAACRAVAAECDVSPQSSKKYHSLPDISGVSVVPRTQITKTVGFAPSVPDTLFGQSLYPTGVSNAVNFDKVYPFRVYPNSSSIDPLAFRSRNPQECFGVARSSYAMGLSGRDLNPVVDPEATLLRSFRWCIVKLLKLEGSEWLFNQSGGIDEDLIDSVAARERLIYEVENNRDNIKQADISGDALLYHSSERRISAMDNGETGASELLISSIPHCGEGCVWRADLIISFGVWCMHRVLDLSLMESRPELWGKYTYVLNRLQGIIDLALAKPRVQRGPCLCIQLPKEWQWRLSSSAVKGGRRAGKWTTAGSLLEMVKEVETAISGRKGRQGTAAGDVAFPKGKENLASVLKRYKRRLSKLGGLT